MAKSSELQMQLAVSAKRKPPLVPTPSFLGAVLAPTAPAHLREIAEELKIRRFDFADDLEEIEARTLCIQFCMARWEYPTWEKNVTGFGLKPLEAFKLFNALCHVCDVHEKENKGSHTTPDA